MEGISDRYGKVENSLDGLVMQKLCFSLFFGRRFSGWGLTSVKEVSQMTVKQPYATKSSSPRVAFPQLSAESSEEQLQIMCHHSHRPGLQCRPRWNSPNLTTEKKTSFKSASASMGFHQDGNLYDLFPLPVPGAFLATCHQKKRMTHQRFSIY